MNSAGAYPKLKSFSHIFVERELLQPPYGPETQAILSRFSKSQVIEVESYADITQRRSASWIDQKRVPKLVLALKRGELLYPCSDVAPNFGNENFYYAVPMQNCLYDCEYCYLQGMYTSPHLVYFLNQQEMIEAAAAKAKELGNLYLCIAYDNDILAMEKQLGVANTWIEGLRHRPDVTVEIRTKSANFRALSKTEAASNFILAWTLSPSKVAELYESKTPPLELRLKAMKEAVAAGWRVRLCLDPLLPIKGWEEHYSQLFQQLDEELAWEKLQDASFGLFRLPKPFLRQARKARPDSSLLQSATEREERGLFTLANTNQLELLDFVESELKKRMEEGKVWQT